MEFQRLARLARHLAGSAKGIPVGVGDDAAVVEIEGGRVVVCVDVVVEGVHFRRDLSSPADVGWKSIAVNVSDIAAMGAVPVAAVVGLSLSPDVSEADVDGLYEGMAEACQQYGVALVGGDTVSSPTWSISVTLLGRPGAAVVTRAGARPGDRVVVVGRLGMASTALWADHRGIAVPEALLAAHRRPQALLDSGQALAAAGATAMIDVSDGLGADARHVCEASGVAMRLDRDALAGLVPDEVTNLLPPEDWLRVVVGGGEDYALVATMPPHVRDLELEAPHAWVGEVVASPTPEVWLGAERIDMLGYEHGGAQPAPH